MVDTLSYFSFQPVFHDWCNKGRGMCHPVCGMMHIKDPLAAVGFLSRYLSGHLPYVRRHIAVLYNKNVLSVSLNKIFRSWCIICSGILPQLIKNCHFYGRHEVHYRIM